MANSNPYNLEDIERYLKNNLSEEEKVVFEAKIEANPDLKERVEWMKNLPDFMFSVEKERLTEQVHSWLDERNTHQAKEVTPKPEKHKARGVLKILKMAASVAAILLLLFIARDFMGSTDDIRSMTNNYIAQYHQDPITLRGKSDDQWSLAIDAYRQRDFNKMIELMQPEIVAGRGTTEQLLYYGLAHLYTKPPVPDTTLAYFSMVKAKDPTIYKETIDWYSGLVYLKKDNPDMARSLLEEVIKHPSAFSKSAARLLNKME